MRNITLSAPEKDLDKARKAAQLRGSSLNNEFRKWIRVQAGLSNNTTNNYDTFIKQYSHIDLSGSKLTREQMNER